MYVFNKYDIIPINTRKIAMNKKIYIREAYKVCFKELNNYLFESHMMFVFIVEFEGRYFDLCTGKEYELIEYHNNIIMNDILENTFYIKDIKPYKYASDNDFNIAMGVIKYNEYLDELKRQRKLLVFPQKIINKKSSF